MSLLVFNHSFLLGWYLHKSHFPVVVYQVIFYFTQFLNFYVLIFREQFSDLKSSLLFSNTFFLRHFESILFLLESQLFLKSIQIHFAMNLIFVEVFDSWRQNRSNPAKTNILHNIHFGHKIVRNNVHWFSTVKVLLRRLKWI